MGPLKRPGHAVPLQEQFGCQAVVLLFCPPKLKCNSKLELLGWPGHAASALRNVGFWRVFGGVCYRVSAYKC